MLEEKRKKRERVERSEVTEGRRQKETTTNSLADRPSESETIVGRRSSTQLVDDDQRVLGRRLKGQERRTSVSGLFVDASTIREASAAEETRANPQNRSGLQHLGHESRHPLELTVPSTDSSENAVEDG